MPHSNSECIHHERKNAIALSLLSLFMMLLSARCSLPKIIISHDPLSPQEHINLGVAYEKNGELDNALIEYKKASKKSDQAFLYIGNIYFQKGELDQAEKYYKKVIRKDPQNADAFNNLAWLYCTKKVNLDKAAECARKALELNPSKAALYQNTLDAIESLRKTPHP